MNASLRLCLSQYLNFRQLRFYKVGKKETNLLSLSKRGLIQEVFPSDNVRRVASILLEKPQCVYAGFDPTAPSLHVGNLLILISLIHAQRGGHQAIALIGGATGQIGDPSGKSTGRSLLSKESLSENVEGIRRNIEDIFSNYDKFFSYEEEKLHPPILLDNNVWYGNMSVVDFMRDIGRFMRVCRMLSRQSVKTRLENDLSFGFNEFSYQVFQAYDWLYLLQNYDCRFQIGGSDQMGNIYAGHEFISRYYGNSSKSEVYGLTVPLVTTESGEKFGKSEGNAVWLSKELTSPYDLYQFFLRQTDEQAVKLLPLFTFRPLKEIQDLIGSTSVRHMQSVLAKDVTLLVHGQTGLDKALQTTQIIFHNDLNALSIMSANDLKDIFSQAPYIRLLYSPGTTVLDLANKMNCFKSEVDALRVISAGGFNINHQRKSNPEEIILPDVHILRNNVTLVRVGKRRNFIIDWAM